jgi:hypothetical protein
MHAPLKVDVCTTDYLGRLNGGLKVLGRPHQLPPRKFPTIFLYARNSKRYELDLYTGRRCDMMRVACDSSLASC